MSAFKRFGKSPRRTRLIVLVACCAGALAVGLAGAASIPSWLDDGISTYNSSHPESKIRFVDIKDSFVWYDMPRSSEIGHKNIRERINGIVTANGYAPMDDEELVTTGKPPITGGKSATKKCWSRSFVLNINAQGDTRAVGEESPGQRQRMLTRLVCEDTSTWWAGFRIAG